MANYANSITTTQPISEYYEKKQLLRRSCYLSVILLVCYMMAYTQLLVLPTLKPQNKYDFVCDERPLCLDTITEAKKSKAQAKKTSPLVEDVNHSNFLSEY